jgi:predicted permease
VIAQDIRYAVRSLGRSPGFTLVALVTLALGIGGTTAIYSVVDGILLRPLPFPDPAAVVSVVRTMPNGDDASFSAADYLDYRRRLADGGTSPIQLVGFRQDVANLTGGAQPVRLTALETTGAFFDVFRVPPLLGRVYRESTDAPTGPRVAVLAESTWRQHLGADPNVVGSTLRVNGIPMSIIGVMPRGFSHPADADLWIMAPNVVPTSPVPTQGDPLAVRDVNYFQVMGRLQPGVTAEQLNARLSAISDVLARELATTDQREIVAAVPYQETLIEDVKTAILVLFGAVGFVLLIACANVAGLLLARGTGRRREFAVRSALGAGRGRLVRQLLTESLILSAAGGVLGLVVAYWGIDALVAMAPESIPRLDEVALDRRVALFAVAASALVGILFGIAPALQGARRDVTDALKDGGRTGTARTGMQQALVVAEVALALVLLIGAGLMLTSFARLRAVDVGFTVENLISVGVPLPQNKYGSAAQTRFYTQLLERLRANPITAQSALAFPTPFTGFSAGASYDVEGRAPLPGDDRGRAQLSIVTPGYFSTLGTPLLRGRDVALTDTEGRPSVIVINQTMAKREWPDQDPIGKRVSFGADDTGERAWSTVIGLVADAKRSDLEDAQQPIIYVPHTQLSLPLMGVMVRSGSGEEAVAAAVRDAVRALDAELPIDDVALVELLLQRATGQPRFRAMLVASFAFAALILAAVGLYGLISYTVAQRVPEIGVRLALGATPFQVGRLVLRQGLLLAAGGIVVGLVGAVAATRFIASLLYSVSATEPSVYIALTALLLGIAALASYLPARRAMRVDPLTALRAE